MPRRQLAIAALAVLLIPALAVCDHVTGIELSFFAFYFIPVAMLAWWIGAKAGLTAAAVCAVVWFIVDRAGGHLYSHASMGIWNALLRAVAFTVLALALARLRRDRDRVQELNRRLTSTVNELRSSLEKIEALRQDVQIVCAWTNRIKSEGRWIKFEDFMGRHFQMRFSHGISEEGMRQLRAEEDRARHEAQPAHETEIGDKENRSTG